MTKSLAFLTILAAVSLFGACGGGAVNSVSNNVVANKVDKAIAAAPTRGLLVELETKALEARRSGDLAFWESFLDQSYVGYIGGKRIDKAGEIKRLADAKCEIGGHTFADEKMVPVGNDAVILTLKATVERKCGGQALPSPVILSTLYIRSGETWKSAYRNEVAITVPPAAKDVAPRKAQAKPSGTAQPEGRSGGKSAPTMTDNLMAVETKIWDAWKTRDAATMGSLFTEDVTLVDPYGNVTVGKKAVIDSWIQPKCEIKASGPVDATGTQTSAVIGILTFRGIADGTCDGYPLSDSWGTTIYQKEAGQWKAAFVFATPIV